MGEGWEAVSNVVRLIDRKKIPQVTLEGCGCGKHGFSIAFADGGERPLDADPRDGRSGLRACTVSGGSEAGLPASASRSARCPLGNDASLSFRSPGSISATCSNG